MKNIKLFVLIFCIFSISQFLISSQNNPTTDRYPTNQQEFSGWLNLNKELITTDHNPNPKDYCNGQTLAHAVINGNRFRFLEIMFNHGETAAIPTNQNQRGKINGSTAFLSLCFKLRYYIDEETITEICKLIKIFAKRTPIVITKARADGITPAMAIACSNPAVTDSMLRFFIQTNPAAFDGQTINFENNRYFTPRTVAHMLIEVNNSIPAFHTVLSHMQQRYSVEEFHKTILSLTQFCDVTNGSHRNYLEILRQYAPELFPQILRNQIHVYSCLDSNGKCLCCAFQCFCCTSPNPRSNHNPFWLNFYQQNPNHPNAQGWFEKYTALVEQVW